MCWTGSHHSTPNVKFSPYPPQWQKRRLRNLRTLSRLYGLVIRRSPRHSRVATKTLRNLLNHYQVCGVSPFEDYSSEFPPMRCVYRRNCIAYFSLSHQLGVPVQMSPTKCTVEYKRGSSERRISRRSLPKARRTKWTQSFSQGFATQIRTTIDSGIPPSTGQKLCTSSKSI